MDNPWYVIGGIAVIILLVAAPFIRRWTRRKAAALGESAGRKFADHQVAKAQEGIPALVARLGTTLVIAAPEGRAREIVTAATVKGKDFTALPDGTFGLRHTEPTDGIAVLVADAAGTRVQMHRFVEQMGYPLLAPFWETFQKRIGAAAKAVGVEVTPGPVQTYTRDGSGSVGVWTHVD